MIKKSVIENIIKNFKKLERTNNVHNLVTYNLNYDLIRQRLFNKIELNMQAVIEDQPNERLYSNIEVMNEFNYIKQDLAFNIFHNKFYNFLSPFPILNVAVSSILSRFNFVFSWIGSQYGLVLLLEDYVDLKKFENFSQLSKSIKDANYYEALECLSYFKEEDVKFLFKDLRRVLTVMAKQEQQMKFLENLIEK
jgi:hypothetical protein